MVTTRAHARAHFRSRGPDAASARHVVTRYPLPVRASASHDGLQVSVSAPDSRGRDARLGTVLARTRHTREKCDGAGERSDDLARGGRRSREKATRTAGEPNAPRTPHPTVHNSRRYQIPCTGSGISRAAVAPFRIHAAAKRRCPNACRKCPGATARRDCTFGNVALWLCCITSLDGSWAH